MESEEESERGSRSYLSSHVDVLLGDHADLREDDVLEALEEAVAPEGPLVPPRISRYP